MFIYYYPNDNENGKFIGIFKLFLATVMIKKSFIIRTLFLEDFSHISSPYSQIVSIIY